MYRAAAVVALDEGVPADDGPALAARIEEEGLRFDWTQRPPRLLLGGRDLTERIRDADVNQAVSVVARQAALRAAMVEAQRAIGRAHPRLVSEGATRARWCSRMQRCASTCTRTPKCARRRVEQMRAGPASRL
ncbi:MAG: (d)CMP kinase [Phycisphaerales bacterium]